MFRGTLNGFLSFDDKLLFVHFHDDLRKTLLFDNEDAVPSGAEPKCGYEPGDPVGNDKFRYEHVIDKRSTAATKKVHGVYQQNVQTRFVELLIVNDHKLVSYADCSRGLNSPNCKPANGISLISSAVLKLSIE